MLVYLSNFIIFTIDIIFSPEPCPESELNAALTFSSHWLQAYSYATFVYVHVLR